VLINESFGEADGLSSGIPAPMSASSVRRFHAVISAALAQAVMEDKLGARRGELCELR
jgi:hypothetical protein